MLQSEKITLPHAGKGCVWALGDAGSSIHVADHSRHSPGAVLDSTPSGATYTAANSSPFEDRGQIHVDVLPESMHANSIDFVNANASVPRISTRLWAKQAQRSTIDDDGGDYVCKAPGETDPIIAKRGVYFIQMHVDNDLIAGVNSVFFVGLEGRDAHKKRNACTTDAMRVLPCIQSSRWCSSTCNSSFWCACRGYRRGTTSTLRFPVVVRGLEDPTGTQSLVLHGARLALASPRLKK